MIDAKGRRGVSRHGTIRLAAGMCMLAVAACVAPLARTGDRLYDTHAHFFTTDTARYPQDLRGAREGETQLRARIAASPNTPEKILATWQANGVTGGVAVQYAEVYKQDNRYVLDSGDQSPTKIAVVVILDPMSPASPAELRRLVREHGVTGVRITGSRDAAGSYGWLDSPAALAMWRVADELGLAIVIMTLPSELSPSALNRIATRAAHFPKARVVLDHVGWARPGADLETLHAAVGARRNVYLKLTSINLERIERAGEDTTTYLRRVVDLFGADRVMWGSDFGRTAMSYEGMVRRLQAAAASLTPGEKRRVMHDTGERIFRRSNAVAERRTTAIGADRDRDGAGHP